MYKNKELNWENDEFKVIKFDLERYEKMNRKHLYYIIECKHCHSQFSRKKESLKGIIHCPKCCHARNGSILTTRLYNMFIHYINNARQRNISWDLSDLEFKDLVLGKCYYCGDFPKSTKTTTWNGVSEAVNGIDRIDSDIGYIKENCVSCCGTCNKMKNNFSQKEFLEKINKIYCNFKSSTTIPNGSTSQANGDGNGELLTAA